MASNANGSLGEQTYEALKEDILLCRLEPGAFVTESDLASRYGVSKTPIREALNLLGRDGFVQSVPRRGTLIKPITLADVRQTYLLRSFLEPPAAELAAKAGDRSMVVELESLLETIRRPPQRGKTDDGHHRLRSDQLRRHRTFHVGIAEASGIPRLARMVNSLHEEVERFMNSAPELGLSIEFGKADGELLDAVIEGDPARAREVAAKSIEMSRDHLLETYLSGRGSWTDET